MQKKPNKWKKSVDQIKNAKIKWTQFSTDKRSVIHHFRLLSLDELQEKYSNLSDFFWRDNGEYFFFVLKIMCILERSWQPNKAKNVYNCQLLSVFYVLINGNIYHIIHLDCFYLFDSHFIFSHFHYGKIIASTTLFFSVSQFYTYKYH